VNKNKRKKTKEKNKKAGDKKGSFFQVQRTYFLFGYTNN
jgi:hypothetical protein